MLNLNEDSFIDYVRALGRSMRWRFLAPLVLSTGGKTYQECLSRIDAHFAAGELNLEEYDILFHALTTMKEAYDLGPKYFSTNDATWKPMGCGGHMRRVMRERWDY